MGRLVKLIGSGIGFTSEVIHAARNRSSNPGSASTTPISRNVPAQESGEYVVVDDETADILIREGHAELPSYSEVQQSIAAEAGDPTDEKNRIKTAKVEHDSDAYSQSDYVLDLGNEVDQDEAVWELDETAQRVRSPTPEEKEFGSATAIETEEAKKEQEKDMVRALVRMAGPVKSTRQIPCPVIIPQRRPGNKVRGFVRAYAPVLNDCGISQDVFMKFLGDFGQASKASKWIEVVWVAAGIVGCLPELAAQITGAIVQTIAGTAREIQSRRRANTFLDRVNQDLFMPRNLYAMVMAFKDEVPGQQHGALGLLSQKLGKTLFATELVDINQPVVNPNFDPAPTIAKYTNTDEHPEMNKVKKRLKNIRLVSGKTYGQLELPEAAPLVYPDLDRAAAQAMEGTGMNPAQTQETLKSAGTWVQEYLDRKAQAAYEIKNSGSPLAVPQTGRKGFVSRYNDPNHPANSGSLTAVLTGGLVGKTSLIERITKPIKESQDAKRLARGEPPSEPIKDKWQRYQNNKKPGLLKKAKKVLQEDVLYLLIVNMPSEEELQQSIARLESLMQQTGMNGKSVLR